MKFVILLGATERDGSACGQTSGHAEMWTGQSELQFLSVYFLHGPCFKGIVQGSRWALDHLKFNPGTDLNPQRPISVCEDGHWNWVNSHFGVNYPFKICSCCCQCTRLQLRGNQQEAELKRREQQINRLKERLLDRPREKGPCETHSCRIFPSVSNICWNRSTVYSHRGVELPTRRPSQTARQILQVYGEVRWFL